MIWAHRCQFQWVNAISSSKILCIYLMDDPQRIAINFAISCTSKKNFTLVLISQHQEFSVSFIKTSVVTVSLITNFNSKINWMHFFKLFFQFGICLSLISIEILIDFNPFVPNAHFLYPLNPPYGFLMFSGARGSVHWNEWVHRAKLVLKLNKKL